MRAGMGVVLVAHGPQVVLLLGFMIFEDDEELVMKFQIKNSLTLGEMNVYYTLKLVMYY